MNELLLAGLKSIRSVIATIGVTGARIVIAAVKIVKVVKAQFLYVITSKKIKLIVSTILLIFIFLYLILYGIVVHFQTTIQLKTHHIFEGFSNNLIVKNNSTMENLDMIGFIKKNETMICVISIAVLIGSAIVYVNWSTIASLLWTTSITTASPVEAVCGSVLDNGNVVRSPTAPITLNALHNEAVLAQQSISKVLEGSTGSTQLGDASYKQYLINTLGKRMRGGASSVNKSLTIEQLELLLRRSNIRMAGKK